MISPNNPPLQGRCALITGGSRGIGRAIALELAHRGAAVAVNYHQSNAAADEVVKQVESEGGRALAIQADVSDFVQAQNLVAHAIQELGGLDILVNNAGIIRDTLIMMMSEPDWDDVLRTNLKSTFNCSKAAVRYMMRKRYGRIINITSVAGQMGNPGQTNYSASKAGQIGFTKALAREVATRGITVNAVAPGYVSTDIIADMPAEAATAIINLTPVGRVGSPEEIAYAVAFLADERAAYITGQVLAVDGGMAMM
jgi:3-oxoacyl-[acyl-carrier protein] reductase